MSRIAKIAAGMAPTSNVGPAKAELCKQNIHPLSARVEACSTVTVLRTRLSSAT